MRGSSNGEVRATPGQSGAPVERAQLICNYLSDALVPFHPGLAARDTPTSH